MEDSDENANARLVEFMEELRKKVQDVDDVLQVYVSEKIKEDQITTFIVKEDMPNSRDSLNRIDEIMEGLARMKFRVYSYSYALRELEKGNLYFIRNCKLGNLLYTRTDANPFVFENDMEIKSLMNKSEDWFRNEIERIQSFTEGVGFYRKRKEKAAAAFLIHQKIEWLYRCMETFSVGEPLMSHKIRNHISYAHPFIHGAVPVFNMKKNFELQLLEVLDKSYSESRYLCSFNISKKELKTLKERARLMENQTKEIFEFRMGDCLSLVQQKKDPPANFANSGGNLHSEKEVLLEDLRNGLVMLTPHETYKGKYRADLLYLKGYGELLFTIRSLLYLCINSLEHADFEAHSTDRHPKDNIQDVLELISRLIPIEEGDLLDKIASIKK